MVEERQVEDIETGSIRSIASTGTTTESLASKRNEAKNLSRELKAIENKMYSESEEDRAAQNEIIAREREKTNKSLDRLRKDVLEAMKSGQDELREEEIKRR